MDFVLDQKKIQKSLQSAIDYALEDNDVLNDAIYDAIDRLTKSKAFQSMLDNQLSLAVSKVKLTAPAAKTFNVSITRA